MTVPPTWSGRWSARPDSDPLPSTEFPAPYAQKAPETITDAATSRSPVGTPSRRVSSKRLTMLATTMNPRDRAILSDVNRFGFMTTAQLTAIHFGALQAADRIGRRVIKRLVDDGLLIRVDRRIGGFAGGSSTSVYRLSSAGYRLVNQGRRTRLKLPSERFLDHRLAVAECYAQLRTLMRTDQLEILQLDPEPGSWRSYLGIGGQPETLKPDLFVVIGSGNFEDHYFIEVDRGTESLPTIHDKCLQYVRYRRTGKEQQVTGLYPIVLWVVTDDRRAEQLQSMFTSAPDITDDICRVTSVARFAQTIAGGAT